MALPGSAWTYMPGFLAAAIPNSFCDLSELVSYLPSETRCSLRGISFLTAARNCGRKLNSAWWAESLSVSQIGKPRIFLLPLLYAPITLYGVAFFVPSQEGMNSYHTLGLALFVSSQCGEAFWGENESYVAI